MLAVTQRARGVSRTSLVVAIGALAIVTGCETAKPTALKASNDAGITVLLVHDGATVATLAPGFRGQVTDVDGWSYPRTIRLTTVSGTELGDPWDASGGQFSLAMGECGEITLWLGGPDPSFDPGPVISADACPAELTLGFPVDCGPIQDAALCQKAVEVASTAKLNPPPIVAASIRLPVPDDACAKAMYHECGPGSVIVVIQSGDTLQDVALVRENDGWDRLDLRR